MPKRSSYKSQRAKEIKAVRKLRDAGLISARVKLTTKPTRTTRSALKRFADVIKGKAAVVEVPKNIARGLKRGFRVVGTKVVIEKRKGERIRFDKSDQRIIGSRKVGKRNFRRSIELDLQSIKPAREGARRYYVVPFQRGGGDIDYLKFDDLAELENFMGEYEKRGYKNWKNYIEIEDVQNREELSDLLGEYPALDSYFYNFRERNKLNAEKTVFKKPGKGRT